jgi:type I restriction enzyme S subunit
MTDKTTVELLKNHFDIALETPDGVKKLRELILSLAMQGKLVPQDPKDQPVGELLKEIGEEKRKLVKEGKIKKQEQLPPVMPEEIPYDVPKEWVWCRIREICHDWGQKTPDKRFTYIDVGAIDNTKGIVTSNIQILESSEAPSRARKIVKPGTVIYSTVRPYLLNIAIIEEEYRNEPIASTAFAILHSYQGVFNRYVYYFLHSGQFIEYVSLQMKGVAYPAINDGNFFQGPFPLPPLAEQKRIVTKIDQLMALCDKLEDERNERNNKRLKIHATAISKLLSAIDKMAFNSSWNFITKNFSELYSVPENVEEMKKAILQLAVMGKLVPQDPKDQPAGELLNEIEENKKRLIKEGKIKKQEVLSPIKPEEIPYEIPKEWVWVKMEALCYGITSGSTPPQNIFSSTEGIPYLKVYNIKNQRIDFNYRPQFIKPDYHQSKSKRSTLYPGDVVMNIVGPPLGKIAIIPNDYPEWNCNQAIVFFRPIIKELNLFIYKYLLAGTFLEKIELIGTAGQDNISVTKSKNIAIPLPPLAEQKRIVAKIDQLMSLCNILEQEIKNSTDKQTAILNAVLAKL